MQTREMQREFVGCCGCSCSHDRLVIFQAARTRDERSELSPQGCSHNVHGGRRSRPEDPPSMGKGGLSKMVQTRNKRRKCQKISREKYRSWWSPGTVAGEGLPLHSQPNRTVVMGVVDTSRLDSWSRRKTRILPLIKRSSRNRKAGQSRRRNSRHTIMPCEK